MTDPPFLETQPIKEKELPAGRPERPLPRLKAGVVLVDMGGGRYVVKDSDDSKYFETGPEEYFLLGSLDGTKSYRTLRSAYRLKFNERLERKDLDDFLESIIRRGLTVPTEGDRALSEIAAGAKRDREEEDEEDDAEWGRSKNFGRLGKGTIFFYRLPLVNPDRLFDLVARTFPWIWSRAFLAITSVAMIFAMMILLGNRESVIESFNAALRLDTLLIVLFASFFTTALHEIAHGATCKRFGGEVRESGFLFMMLIPCLYVNVSDAWLIRQRWKRLAITAAGGYMDLCLWCIAVFVWRVSLPGTLLNHLSFVVLTTCGARGLINFNPLLRFDGYYLLSDCIGIPNLYTQGREYWLKHLNWILWGAPRPQRLPRGKTLFSYGFFSWLFSIVFLNVVLINMVGYVSLQFGIAGFLFGALLMAYAIRRVFRGFIGIEFVKMLRTRFVRVVSWLALIAACTVLVFLIPVPYYTFGDFEIRPSETLDIPVPVSSFIEHVFVEDGEFVKAGTQLVQLRAPDVLSQIDAKSAELKESEANLLRLKAGPRAEEIAEQESRVKRLDAWSRLGELEVETTRTTLKHQLEALEHRIGQAKTELEYAQKAILHSERLAKQGALAEAQLERERSRILVLQERLAEYESQRSATATEGIRVAIAELSRRQQELADAEAKLRLLKIGSRPEDIAAEEARRQRLVEELEYLNEQKTSLVVSAPADGFVSSSRLREKIGSYGTKGSLLCQIQTQGLDRVEVFVPEDDAMSVATGQSVILKARALPLETFHGEVERIAPAASQPQETMQLQNPAVIQTLVLHCRVEGAAEKLKSGMTGYARVSKGWSTLGHIVQLRVYKYIRTEFWW